MVDRVKRLAKRGRPCGRLGAPYEGSLEVSGLRARPPPQWRHGKSTVVAMVVVVPIPPALDDYMFNFGCARHIICGNGNENSLRPISAHDFFWC